MGNILSSGPVQLPVDPSKLTTKELLNGGRTIPKPPVTTAPGAGAPKGVFGTRMAAAATKVPWWQNLLGHASLLSTIASTLTGDSSRTNKWKRLGYKSQEQYDEAMRAYELKTGKSSETGKPLTQEQ